MHKVAIMDDMAKVTVTLYIDEEDKEALQAIADAEERSLSQMAVLILKRAIRASQSPKEQQELQRAFPTSNGET